MANKTCKGVYDGTRCCKKETKPALRFQYGKKKDGQWYWHIRAGNSEIIAQGEGYKRAAGPLKVYRLLFGANSAAALIAVI